MNFMETDLKSPSLPAQTINNAWSIEMFYRKVVRIEIKMKIGNN